VAQDCIITIEDCGTTKGIVAKAMIEGGEVVVPLADKILGRTSAKDISHPTTEKVIVKAGQLLDEKAVELIDEAGIEQMMIRSVLTCESEEGVCGKCYGRDLARGTPVNIGEAVGVIAAQSIGEPGTQLTMRTFHIGGAAQRGAEQSGIEASHDSKLELSNKNVVKDSKGRLVVMSRTCESSCVTKKAVRKRAIKFRTVHVCLVEEGATVKKGQKLVDWDPYTIPIITERTGIANYRDLVQGISLNEVTDEATGMTNKKVIDFRQQTRGRI
jgi:DNA-directed RNA polymerase subunit beta'